MPLGSNSSYISTNSSCSHCGHCRGKRAIPPIGHIEYDQEKGKNLAEQFNMTTTQSEVKCSSPHETDYRNSGEFDREFIGMRSAVRVVRSYSLHSGKEEQILGRDG